MRGLDRGNQTDLDSGVMNDAVKGIEASSLFHCQQLQDEKENIDKPQRRCCSESLGLCGLPITVPANSIISLDNRFYRTTETHMFDTGDL